MSLRTRVMGAAVAAALAGCAMPAVASAEPNVDAAVAAFKDLGLTPLTTMPSGRVVSPTVGSAENFGYRTYDQINQELANLASANPTLVTLKTAPRKSVEGRDIKYVEITNNVGAYDGQPGLLHDGLDPRRRVGRGRAHAGVHLRRDQHVQDEPEGQGAPGQGRA